MDTLAHGLWGGLIVGWKKRFALALLFGCAPDIIWTGTSLTIIVVEYAKEHDNYELADWWRHTGYDYTHSLIIAGVILLIVWFTARNLAIPFLAWPLHILCDIPTHSEAIFPTPFLFPLSDYTFDGISWANPYFMLVNYTSLLVITLVWVAYRLKKKKETIKKNNSTDHGEY